MFLVSSILTISPDDRHEQFLYYLPTTRLEFRWANQWM